MSGRTVVVSGYVTADYAASLGEDLRPGMTAPAVIGAAGAWPRPGGAPFYVCRQLVRARHAAFPLSWAGRDSEGASVLDAFRDAGIRTEAICTAARMRTPRCLLMHAPGGGTTCLFDPDMGGAPGLQPAQLQALARAEHLCVSAGPPEVSRTLLDMVPSACSLSWIAKLDEACFPHDLRRSIAARAGLIFCNSAERAFVADALGAGPAAGQTIIQTLGSRGVLVEDAAGSRHFPCAPVAPGDATGAGDTLAGAVLAALLSDAAQVETAVARGIAAAHDLLMTRVHAF